MPMTYAYTAIGDDVIPVATEPLLQHALDTYVSETNKVASVWREFSAGVMALGGRGTRNGPAAAAGPFFLYNALTDHLGRIRARARWGRS